MKKLVLSAIAVIVLIPAAIASAYTSTGVTLNFDGSANFPNALVHIHNNTTGANGSTNSDSNGAYTFTNLVSGTVYSYWAEKCKPNPVSGSSYFKSDTQNSSGSAPFLKLSYRNPC